MSVLIESLHIPEWVDEALCAQTDPELFFPEQGNHGAGARAAKRVCAGCPVRAECLDYALAEPALTPSSPFYFGIWGGLAAYQRRKIQRERAAAS